jgi:hypothetical protein
MYFLDRVLCFSLVLVSTYTSHVAGTTSVHHWAWLVGWDGISLTFCPNWPQTVILPMFTSRIARITGISYHACILIFKLTTKLQNTVLLWYKASHKDLWKITENPELNPYIYGQLIFN